MRKYIIGFILGIIFGGGSVWAYGYMNIHLQDINGNDFGSTSNPIYVTTN